MSSIKNTVSKKASSAHSLSETTGLVGPGARKGELKREAFFRTTARRGDSLRGEPAVPPLGLVYFDHAAACPLDPRVFEAMKPFFTDFFGNPSSIYQFAQKAHHALLSAREKIASIIECQPREIIFTSGGTESNNLFIQGLAQAAFDLKLPGRHIISTKIEHESVLKPLQYLESHGFELTYLPVGQSGIVDPVDFKKALREDTLLVTIMYANNEIGTIQPIAEIAEIIAQFRAARTSAKISDSHVPHATYRIPFFHTDACQAAPYLDISAKTLGVDAMTLSGSKIYGPKGAGALFLREGIPLNPQMRGGGQEYRKRSGTENVPAIVGFAKALELVADERAEESKRLLPLREKLIDGILQTIPDARCNGDREKRLPNNVNVSFKGLEGEAILLRLDMLGIAASAGSACTSGTLEPSHVIQALGLPDEFTHSATRFTLGHGTDEHDIDFLLKNLPFIVKELRETSPFV